MKTTVALSSLFLLALSNLAVADTFGIGANTFNIDFVAIGNPDNPDDTAGSPNPAGKVDYEYRLGKYEISQDMIEKANALGGLGITYINRGANKPATSVNWFEAAQFVNWLNTSTFHSPAYKFSGSTFQLWQPGDVGYDPNNPFRNSQAFYFLPTSDEWYKAAFYDPAAGVYYIYATGSNTAPTIVLSGTAPNTAVYGLQSIEGPADVMLAGGLSPYGTMGQGGNVREWEETEFDLVNDSVSGDRGVRQSGWTSNTFDFSSAGRVGIGPNTGGDGDIGFRVASLAVPEPSTLALAFIALAALPLRRRK